MTSSSNSADLTTQDVALTIGNLSKSLCDELTNDITLKTNVDVDGIGVYCNQPNYSSWATSMLCDDYEGEDPVRLRDVEDKLISYTQLNGLEEAIFIRSDHVVKFSKKRMMAFQIINKFPFFKASFVIATDLEYLDKDKKTKHIYALESPTLLAKKFGLLELHK